VDASDRRSWVRAMMLVAVTYVVIGIGFAALAKSADAGQVRLWRLAAWLASAAVAAAHIIYEHYRLRESPRPVALHAAGAVAAPCTARVAGGHCCAGVSGSTRRGGRAGSLLTPGLVDGGELHGLDRR